jgi:stage V sporulation protein G
MMNVTEARVTRVDGRGSLKAFASICLNGEFVVDGFRVVEKDGEVIVFSPEKSKRNEDGTYTHRNTAYPLNSELRNAIHTAIKDAYAKA